MTNLVMYINIPRTQQSFAYPSNEIPPNLDFPAVAV